MEIPQKENIFGFRTDGVNWFIGNMSVEFQNDNLIISNETFNLSDGLLNLLTSTHPKRYSTKDLSDYKEILLLTNAHRRHFNPNEHIKSSSSWKYANIIAKLFPPKRTYDAKTRAVHENNEAPREPLEAPLDVNELVDRFRQLHNGKPEENPNLPEIMRILRELEKLGVIEFYK